MEHVTMTLIIMVLYHLLCAWLAAILFWNFWTEKKDRDSLWLSLLVLVPLLLRIFRIK